MNFRASHNEKDVSMNLILFDTNNKEHKNTLLEFLRDQVAVHNAFEQEGRPFVNDSGVVRYYNRLLERAECDESTYVWLWIESDTTKGFVVADVSQNYVYDTKECFLDEVYIAPEYRHQGCGSKMLDDVRQIAKNNLNCALFSLCCLNNNAIGQAFYKKIGLHPAKTVYMLELKGESDG